MATAGAAFDSSYGDKTYRPTDTARLPCHVKTLWGLGSNIEGRTNNFSKLCAYPIINYSLFCASDISNSKPWARDATAINARIITMIIIKQLWNIRHRSQSRNIKFINANLWPNVSATLQWRLPSLSFTNFRNVKSKVLVLEYRCGD